MHDAENIRSVNLRAVDPPAFVYIYKIRTTLHGSTNFLIKMLAILLRVVRVCVFVCGFTHANSQYFKVTKNTAQKSIQKVLNSHVN